MERRARTTRRRFLAGIGGAAVVAGFPAVLRAQTRELVVGGAAGMAQYMRELTFPLFEKKHNAKVLFEGTRSLVNLEKMRADKAQPKMSVILMDDPVMLIANQEGLIEKLTAADVPNIAKIKKEAVHLDGMWVNYQHPWAGVAFNKTRMPGGVGSWAELWDPQYKGKVVIPSLQNTEGLWTMVMAAHLETGKPFKDAQYDVEAAFKKLRALKPNLLTIYTNAPQAINLLEQGEAYMIGGQFSSYTLLRMAAGAPVDLAAPREGAFVMPAGICKVKGGPHPDLANAFINEYLSPDYQKIFVEKVFVLPVRTDVAMPARTPKSLFLPDWAFVSKSREAWIERWNREMAA